jgi:hypothetical protein
MKSRRAPCSIQLCTTSVALWSLCHGKQVLTCCQGDDVLGGAACVSAFEGEREAGGLGGGAVLVSVSKGVREGGRSGVGARRSDSKGVRAASVVVVGRVGDVNGPRVLGACWFVASGGWGCVGVLPDIPRIALGWALGLALPRGVIVLGEGSLFVLIWHELGELIQSELPAIPSPKITIWRGVSLTSGMFFGLLVPGLGSK